MRVNVNDLKEGSILLEDVFCKTNRPILPKKTILTNDLIEFLKAFLINEVEIEETLVNGLRAYSDEEYEINDENYFHHLFLKAANQYKREFQSWQAGMPVSVVKIRNIVLPLIDQLETSSLELFSINHYSTENEYLYQHAIATGLISGYIGKKLGYSKGDIVQLVLAGCLSDCGMVKVNNSILNKKGALTREEFEEIKQHPVHSLKMVQDSTLLRNDAKIAIFQHHERLDGSGYPLGEKGKKIHSFAKIIAVADTFHAVTSTRLYRKKQSPFKVLEMILEDNFGKYDLVVVKVLLSGIIHFSIGSKVKLSNGQIGEIMFIGEKSPTRPIVKIQDTGEVLPLEKYRELFIEEIL